MTDEMTPEEGIDALMRLIGDIGDAAERTDGAALDRMIGEIGGIVSATGVSLPGIEADLAALRDENAKIAIHGARVDAALWAGDLSRARALIEAGVPLDLGNIPGLADDDWDEDEAGEPDEDLAAILAEFEAIEDETPPDLYADIAAGRPGAIDAFIAGGGDPNLPSGAACHSALFAALDAPGRRLEGIARLVETGADPLEIHAQGDNALSWAAGYHHPETVTTESESAIFAFLARAGADPEHMPEGSGWTPLQRAVIQGDEARVAGMLAADGDLAALTAPRFEPAKLAGAPVLVLAAPKPAVLRLLLFSGADPHRRDAAGRLPLDVVTAEAEAAAARVLDDWDAAHAAALAASRDILSAATIF